jgi:hypothetical protein
VFWFDSGEEEQSCSDEYGDEDEDGDKDRDGSSKWMGTEIM